MLLVMKSTKCKFQKKKEKVDLIAEEAILTEEETAADSEAVDLVVQDQEDQGQEIQDRAVRDREVLDVQVADQEALAEEVLVDLAAEVVLVDSKEEAIGEEEDQKEIDLIRNIEKKAHESGLFLLNKF